MNGTQPSKCFQIHFIKALAPITAAPGQTMMAALLAGGRPVASSCNGDGVCGKCRVQIVAGQANLTPENDLERSLRERHGLAADERISCQTQVLGEITVDTSYW